MAVVFTPLPAASKLDAVIVAKYDGKEVAVTGTGLSFDTTAIKQIDANTLTEERSKKGGMYHVTVRRVVSADGKTMTGPRKAPAPMARRSHR